MGIEIITNLQASFLAAYVSSCDLHRIDAGDGVQEIVSFINDDHVAF